MPKHKKPHTQTAASAVQLSATLWCMVLNILPLHERWEPRLVCKKMLQASSPWRPPMFVIVHSVGTRGDEKSPRATTSLGSHVKATLREALSCYKLFRQKEPSRLFEIRLGNGVHETGTTVFGGHGNPREPVMIGANDIRGFNLQGKEWKNLLIRSP